jgi:hypothetical protein
MEVIKKTILQAVTTGTTTGCTGSCRVIIPDLTKVYYIKVLLTQDTQDCGFFDVDTDEQYPYQYPYNNNELYVGIGYQLLN